MAGKQDIPSIERIAELQQLIANFGRIERMIHLADTEQPENDAEHSFGLALTCLFVAPKIAPKLSLEKILRCALAHDIVEIHSGDTFAFDKEGVKKKDALERQALKKLSKEWPDFPEMIDAAREYMDKSSPEARFVYTIDKILPTVMVNLGEKDKFWHRHKITLEMEKEEKNSKMKHSPEALPYLDMLLDWVSDPDYTYKP
jgi:putative hydrolase of HD superfamily